MVSQGEAPSRIIRTPDQRVRVFVSSTMGELADERIAAREAVERLGLAPVMFELGARPHPAQELYRAYLEQSHVFVGIYWQQYGWVAPGTEISGLVDEYQLAERLDKPRLLYLKDPAAERDPRLAEFIGRIRGEGRIAYRLIHGADELRELLAADLSALLSERFEAAGLAGARSLEPRLAAPAAELPRPPTRFIGRQAELERSRTLLLHSDARLLTLTGAGGIGKTRLAIQLAPTLAPTFPDGIWFVRLSLVSDPEMVAEAIARGLGIAGATGLPPLEACVAYLSTRRALLILDNFEQVVAAGSVVALLLERCSSLKVLVTSREVLRISGEHVLPVPPLDLPDPDRRLDRGDLARSESIALFVERASAANPQFRLTPQNTRTVWRICHRLEGLPLAIELAAARVRAIPPDEILRRLGHGLSLLEGGGPDRPSHQRAIGATVSWSYRLLTAREQLLFERLAVFAPRWTLEAAEAVCGDESIDVLDGVTSLVEKSLIVPSEHAGEWRYSMLQAVREFGRDRLEARGRLEEMRLAHFRYYQALARASYEALRGPQETACADRLELERENVHQALDWAVSTDAFPDGVFEMGWSLWPFWWLRGHIRFADRLMRIRESKRDRFPEAMHGRIAAAAGAWAYFAGDFRRAAPLLEEGLAICRRLGDRVGEAIYLLPCGLLAQIEGDVTTARRRMEEAIALNRDLQDLWCEALAGDALGRLLVGTESPDARPILEQALDTARASGTPRTIGGALNNIGLHSALHGLLEEAGGFLAEALDLFVEIQHGEGAARSVDGIALLAERLGNLDASVRLFSASSAYRQAVGSEMWIVDRPQCGRAIEKLRARLGAEAFDTRWEAGAAMSIDEGVALARVVLEEAASGPHAVVAPAAATDTGASSVPSEDAPPAPEPTGEVP